MNIYYYLNKYNIAQTENRNLLEPISKFDLMKNETRYALEAAKYHLNMMEKTIDNVDRFSYNRRSFLSAARNITLSMQKQFKKSTGFEDWYETKRELMKNDECLRSLNEERQKCVHNKNRIEDMEYFFKLMSDTFQEGDEFSYNLNAFIIAARCTSEHLNVCRNSIESIFSRELAAFQIHESTLTTGATRELTYTVSCHINPSDTQQEKEYESAKLHKRPNMPIQKAPTTLERWFWETGRYLKVNDRPYFEGKDVMESCTQIFNKLKMQMNEYNYIDKNPAPTNTYNDRKNEVIFWRKQLEKLEEIVIECESKFLK